MTSSLQTALDFMAIQNIKAAYCRAADEFIPFPERSRGTLTELLCESVTADFGYIRLDGRNALVDYMGTTFVQDAYWLWHSIHSPQIEIDGDTAHADWTLLLKMHLKATDVVVDMRGRYHDEFVRTELGWAICDIRLIDLK